MKKSKFITAVLVFIGLTAFGQANSNTAVTGTIKDVRAYNDECAMTVGGATIVLIVDLKDTSNKGFEINKEYKDLVIKNNGKYELNPKYSNQTFNISYYVNGKGWKCIKEVEPVSSKN